MRHGRLSILNAGKLLGCLLIAFVLLGEVQRATAWAQGPNPLTVPPVPVHQWPPPTGGIQSSSWAGRATLNQQFNSPSIVQQTFANRQSAPPLTAQQSFANRQAIQPATLQQPFVTRLPNPSSTAQQLFVQQQLLLQIASQNNAARLAQQQIAYQNMAAQFGQRQLAYQTRFSRLPLQPTIATWQYAPPPITGLPRRFEYEKYAMPPVSPRVLAGWQPAQGPAVYRLANGREIWFAWATAGALTPIGLERGLINSLASYEVERAFGTPNPYPTLSTDAWIARGAIAKGTTGFTLAFAKDVAFDAGRISKGDWTWTHDDSTRYYIDGVGFLSGRLFPFVGAPIGQAIATGVDKYTRTEGARLYSEYVVSKWEQSEGQANYNAFVKAAQIYGFRIPSKKEYEQGILPNSMFSDNKPLSPEQLQQRYGYTYTDVGPRSTRVLQIGPMLPYPKPTTLQSLGITDFGLKYSTGLGTSNLGSKSWESPTINSGMTNFKSWNSPALNSGTSDFYVPLNLNSIRQPTFNLGTTNFNSGTPDFHVPLNFKSIDTPTFNPGSANFSSGTTDFHVPLNIDSIRQPAFNPGTTNFNLPRYNPPTTFSQR
jgi:hypothetical protein